MINFTKGELKFFKKMGINPQKLKTRWEWVDKEKALAFYRDIIYSHFNRIPKKDEIDKIGYRGFRTALRRIGKTTNDLIRELGFKPYFEHKYSEMKFQDLADFFFNSIYTDLKKRLQLKDNKPPTRSQIENNGYRGFTDRLSKLNHTYGELLRVAGFKPLKQFKYKGKSYKELIELLINEIYPKLIKKNLVKVGIAPNENQLNKQGYTGLTRTLRRSGIKLSTFFKDAGLKVIDIQKYKNMKYEELLQFFINDIYPNLKKVYSLGYNEAPLYDHIEKHYRGFLAAIERVGKKYSEAILDAGFEQTYGKYRDICNLDDLVRTFKEEIYPNVLEQFKSKNIVLEEISFSREFLEETKLSDLDKEILRCSVILHDIGRYNPNMKNHALSSRKFIERIKENIDPKLRKEIALLAQLHTPSGIKELGGKSLADLVEKKIISKRQAYLASILTIGDALDAGKARVQKNTQGEYASKVINKIKESYSKGMAKSKLEHWYGHQGFSGVKLVKEGNELNLRIILDSKMIEKNSTAIAFRIFDTIKDITTSYLPVSKKFKLKLKIASKDSEKAEKWYNENKLMFKSEKNISNVEIEQIE